MIGMVGRNIALFAALAGLGTVDDDGSLTARTPEDWQSVELRREKRREEERQRQGRMIGVMVADLGRACLHLETRQRRRARERRERRA